MNDINIKCTLNKSILFLSFAVSIILFMLKINNTEFISTSIFHINNKYHKEQLHNYDSPYTICYRNKDNTYSMYIFASPIQYLTDKGYIIIDNTIVKSKYKNYIYENKSNKIKTYYPKSLKNKFRIENEYEYMEFQVVNDVDNFKEAKELVFKNMYGDIINAVCYESNDSSLYFYSTKSGIKCEAKVYNKQDEPLKFNVDFSNNMLYEDSNNGYIIFKNSSGNRNILYSSIIKNSLGDFCFYDNINLEKSINNFTLYLENNESNSSYPIYVDTSFEFYLNKMPDTSVYSKFNINCYLKQYAVLGNDDLLGEGWQYLRLRLNYLLSSHEDNVISMSYNIKCLNNPSQKDINVIELNEQWTSTNMLWSNRIYSDVILDTKITSKEGYFKIDLTEYGKACVSDDTWMKESYGLLLKANSKVIVATSDNSLYTPYIQIILKELPIDFVIRDNINPT